ncbi:SRPBCC family protein [Pseudonocardia xinjiangensis]|uniref:SRPBCC family protein n=1 Tax=Pseudonocardia xinjiangensis TaxID=75289 RepID=UPI0028A6A0B0|nr:SRPBCC family protein [Pseudonocardia xinjiangensis]
MDRRTSDGRTRRGATGLALFSLGLGSAQVGAPGAVAQLVGADDSPTSRLVTRWACGVRELAAGLGVGSSSAPGPWLWARVAGDVVDLALLGTVAARHPARRTRTLAAAAAVLGVAAADVATARRATGGGLRSDELSVQAAITVNRPVGEVFDYWHDLTNLPRFMAHLEDVTLLGSDRSRWTAKAPAGVEVTWEAEITAHTAEELIAWRSVEGSAVATTGRVRFQPAPGDRGTEVHVAIEYRPPAGRLGSTVAKMFGESPDQQIHDDLRRFKQVLETGEVVLSDGSPEGTTASRQLRQRPAQPLSPSS